MLIVSEKCHDAIADTVVHAIGFYKGGGGHGGYYDPTQPSPYSFSAPSPNYAENGVTNTGGGGGGNAGPYGTYYAGNGGSGIVIIRYSYP